MDTESTTAKQLRLDERNHVEKPLLDQLAGLGWEVIDLTDKKVDAGHHPSGWLHRGRDAAGAARTAQGHQNPSLEDHQIEEGVKRLAGEKRVTPSLESVEPH